MSIDPDPDDPLLIEVLMLEPRETRAWVRLDPTGLVLESVAMPSTLPPPLGTDWMEVSPEERPYVNDMRWDGQTWQAVDRSEPPPSAAALAALQALAHRDAGLKAVERVNRMFSVACDLFVTPINGRQMVYLEKRTQARAWMADPAPDIDDPDYLLIKRDVILTGLTAYECVQIILNKSAQWTLLADAMDGIRMPLTEALMTVPVETMEDLIGQGRAALLQLLEIYGGVPSDDLSAVAIASLK